MKKSTLMKLALTMVAIFVMVGAQAQTYPAAIQDPAHANALNYVVPTETTYQTTGLGLTLYVAPDPVYSPLYNGVGVVGINASSAWRWVYGVDFLTGTLIKDWTVLQNYAAIPAGTLPAAGSTLNVWAAERQSGACADNIGKNHVITVLPVPSATLDGANTAAAWSVAAANEFYRCGEGYVDDLTLNFAEAGVIAPYNRYAYTITATVAGYDATGVEVVAAVPSLPHGISVGAADATFVLSGSTVVIPANMDYVQDGGVDVRTKYVFTLATVASKTSTLSHYRAGVANAFYAEAGANDIVTYWLNLPPVTGPIYHIPNNFAL
ncbi:MAG: hypothetical protein EHM93_17280 [Bacteroidales bacterium]|nr:MAG: hypothetical protein EHM93_17280 [Bacteroidales bacterium]